MDRHSDTVDLERFRSALSEPEIEDCSGKAQVVDISWATASACPAFAESRTQGFGSFGIAGLFFVGKWMSEVGMAQIVEFPEAEFPFFDFVPLVPELTVHLRQLAFADQEGRATVEYSLVSGHELDTEKL